MFSLDSLKEIKVLEQNGRQKISLVQSQDGTFYLKREISDDKREIYKALQKINHPNIPQIYYVGLADNTVVIEEYIDGISLNAFMEQDNKMSKKEIISLSKQVLSALEALHENKIIHKDIKPDNILVNKSNHVWLIDYDISKIHRNEVRKDTELKGTFGYAPIEQYGMLPTDYKTDIYAFGVTLKAVLEHYNYKGGIYKIAKKCMRLDPSERYTSVKKVKRAIGRIVIKQWTAVGLVFALAIFGIGFYHMNHAPEGYVKISDEYKSMLRFEDFNNSEAVQKYYTYDGYDSLTIFGVDSPVSHLLFIEDTTLNGKILMGKEQQTKVDATITLKDGRLLVMLKDLYGHTFEHEFEYDGQHEYELRYSDNIRQNADVICWDMDKDGIEELLVGVDDASFMVNDNRILSYMNYCQAWCIKYDEGRGFTLCSGDMFSENSKFWLYKDELGVWLPYLSATLQKYKIEKYLMYGDEVRQVYVE